MNKPYKIILTAMFAALTAVGAFIRIPVGVSSFTMQFFFTALAGLLLPPAYAALSQAVYIVLGIAGLPIFTSGGGIGSVMSTTFGFVAALPLTAFVISMIVRKNISFLRAALACVCGLAVLYAVGLPYMGAVLNLYMNKNYTVSGVIAAGMLPFLPFDAAKIVLAALIAPRIRKLIRKD